MQQSMHQRDRLLPKYYRGFPRSSESIRTTQEATTYYVQHTEWHSYAAETRRTGRENPRARGSIATP